MNRASFSPPHVPLTQRRHEKLKLIHLSLRDGLTNACTVRRHVPRAFPMTASVGQSYASLGEVPRSGPPINMRHSAGARRAYARCNTPIISFINTAHSARHSLERTEHIERRPLPRDRPERPPVRQPSVSCEVWRSSFDYEFTILGHVWNNPSRSSCW